ncbi:uncharacterized protein EDB91DRAFT_1088029 [Suillus paluster]|uniref:uncharacterized protein n=1 Tax=Suillus paluster TaxID=48578 RepID=UPI001B87DE99|nr:uncharacterized protein EDB91DRAFT_1088029 [Suillus paluster]KAG1722735.1 hypothetical protein EDB91DRAFT_1088029 [Suillus paluster]
MARCSTSVPQNTERRPSDPNSQLGQETQRQQQHEPFAAPLVLPPLQPQLSPLENNGCKPWTTSDDRLMMACICSGVRYMGGRCCQNIAKGHHINLAREHRIKGHHQHKGHHTTMGFNIAGGRSSNAPTKTSILERLDAAEKKIEKLENEGADKGKPPKKAATPNISNEHPILEDPSLGKAKRVEVLIAIKPLPNREPFEISENLIPLSMQNLFQSVSNCSECTGAYFIIDQQTSRDDSAHIREASTSADVS